MIHRYPIDVTVDIPDESLALVLLRIARENGDRTAFIEGVSGRRMTYTQLADGIEAAAAGLAARGLRKGDVLGIYSVNLPEFAIAYYGTLLAGGILTPINPLYTIEEVVFQLRDSGARFLVTIPELFDRAREAAAETGITEVFVFGAAEGATPFSTLLETGNPVPDVEIDAANDIAALPYSSGTTGLPKGVMLTHRNLVANLHQAVHLDLIKHDDVIINVLPMFHIYGLHAVTGLGLFSGATLITVPKFDLPHYLELVQTHRATFAFVVPPIVLALAKHPLVDQFDVSSLRMAFSGAAPLDEKLTQACVDRLGIGVRQGYGMTETSPVATMDPNGTGAKKYGSVGRPLPLTEVKIADLDSGAELGPNERGEICIRGPQVMKGYLHNPTATAQMLDADGWLHTGDVAYADDDGYFFIVDRVKELIKYKAFQVAPAELEAILLAHPAIADAAVVPSPDDEAGEIPKAFVVRRADIGAEEVMAIVAEHVAHYKRIRAVEFIDQIPKSPSGKILRRVLIERERARILERKAAEAQG